MNDKRVQDKEWFLDGMPKKITELVEHESDRGAILILGAYIEELLGELIRSACTSNENADKLLEFRKPAGDFDSKILLCLAFGLMHENEAKALHAIRKIRNRAAHFDKKGQGFDVLFDAEQTIAHVSNLAEAMNLRLESREPDAVKALFEVSTRLLAAKIMIRAILAKQPQPVQTINEIANEYRSQIAGTEQGERLKNLEEGGLEAMSAYFKNLATYLRARSEEEGAKNDS